MNGDWQEVTVNSIAAQSRNALVGGPFGSNLVSKDYVPVGIPVIRGQNMSERWVGGEFVYVTKEKASTLSSNLAKPGDLVFTQRGTLGQVAIVPEGSYDFYVISQSQMKLTVDSSIADPLFFYYVFCSPKQLAYIEQNAIKVGVPHTNLGILRNTPIPLPPLPEQQRISSILGTIDNKIALNRQMNQTLEAMAQALFKSWFVDFEPVRAKVAALEDGEDTTQAAMRAISGKNDAELSALQASNPKAYDQLHTTASLFPAAFEESELGFVPEGWEVGKLSDFCKLNNHSWSTATLPSVINYVDLANTKEGEINYIQEFINDDAPSRARRILKQGDTIVGTVRPGNRSFAFVGHTEITLTGSTGFAVLTPLKTDYQELVYLTATSEENVARLSRLADGGAYPAVRPDVVVQEMCVIANDEIYSAFHKVTSPIFRFRQENFSTNQSLSSLRDTLLPKLLSGELTVAETVEETANVPESVF